MASCARRSRRRARAAWWCARESPSRSGIAGRVNTDLAAVLAQAQAARDQGRSADAETLYRNALAHSGGLLPGGLALGALWFAAGRLDEAAALHRRIVAAHPESAAAW